MIISAMYRLINALLSTDIVDNIVDLVQAAFSKDMPGEQKKAAVMAELKDIGGDVGEAINATAGFIISMAVDVVVAYLKTRNA